MGVLWLMSTEYYRAFLTLLHLANMEGGKEVLGNIVGHVGAWFYCFIINMKLERLETHFDFPQNNNNYSWKFTAFSFKDVLHCAPSSEIAVIHFTSKL